MSIYAKIINNDYYSNRVKDNFLKKKSDYKILDTIKILHLNNMKKLVKK